jgi:AcrR family transcriptional regulator
MPAQDLEWEEMGASTTRRPRADALRNRQRLIDAAVQVFAEQGLDVAVAEIARRAGVGTATLFRNFPTKDDLIYAVIEARVHELLAVAERAQQVEDPGAAFEQFLTDVCEFQTRDRGFFEAIHSRLIDEPELMQCKSSMMGVAEQILTRAQEAGAVRKDVGAEDLGFLVQAAATQDGHNDRYLRILLDGLRPPHAA